MFHPKNADRPDARGHPADREGAQRLGGVPHPADEGDSGGRVPATPDGHYAHPDGPADRERLRRDRHCNAYAFAFAVHREHFQAKVLDASHRLPILVDFWADWCAPCRALSPHLERVIDEYGGTVLLAKVEVDEGDNMKLAGHYRLRGFPTVILFQGGEELGRFSGSRSSYQVREWIHEHLLGSGTEGDR